MTTCSGTPTVWGDEDGEIFFECADCGFSLHLGCRPSLPQVIAASYAHRYNTERP